jgi:hypothetical protein
VARDALAAVFLGAGWAVDVAEDSEPGGFTLGAFRLPIGPEFSVAARFDLTSLSGPDGEVPLEVTGTIGVSYERAYRLWPVVQDSEGYELAIDLGELLDSETEVDEPLVVEISDPADVPVAVEQLATPVLAHAAAWAGRYVPVEVVLDVLRHDERYSWHRPRALPLVLAAAGRVDDARQVLDEFLVDAAPTDRRFRRFAYQLRRWLDSGGELPPPPTGVVGEPLRDRRARREKESRQERNARREAIRQAIDRLRPETAGKTRDQLRQMVRAEFGLHDIILDDPITLEMVVDSLEVGGSWFQRQRLGLSFLKTFGQALGALVHLIRTDQDPRRPDWLEPPINALHDIPIDHRRWVTVTVDAAAEPLLRRAYEALEPAMFNTVHLDIWLKRREADGAGGDLEVHIGTEPVGVIDPAERFRYEPAMQQAAQQGEQPLLGGRILRLRDGGYLLSAGVPEDDDPATPT